MSSPANTLPRPSAKASLPSRLPVLNEFSQVADTDRYAPIPDDWAIGVADVVGSTAAITSGRYKAVNLAGAGTISAVQNALGGELRLFIFAGDGARFVVPPAYARRAAEALARVKSWVRRELELDLRVGMVAVAEARSAGQDVRAALWKASENVDYAVFVGGGLEWAEAQLKADRIGLPIGQPDGDPDLTGLSCQWGSVPSRLGNIISLIVKPSVNVSTARFAQITNEIVAILENSASGNPIPGTGPEAKLSSEALALQARVVRGGHARWLRYLRVLATTLLMFLMFRLGIRVGGFEPDRYRRELSENTDFRKFDDGLMMTVDCTPDVADRIERLLDKAMRQGEIRYGLHRQEAALVTCVVPSVTAADHMHFVDGSAGGYAAAAQQLYQ